MGRKLIVAATLSFGLVVGGISAGIVAVDYVNESQSLQLRDGSDVSIQAGWNFENKNTKNKKRKVTHRGGW